MNNHQVITAGDEPIATALHSLRNATRKVSSFVRNYQPPMDGERYMTDKEVSQTLKISRRTLQEYRNEKILPYIIFGGKVLYRESDIQETLQRNYRTAMP